jgi:hypothetical protein
MAFFKRDSQHELAQRVLAIANLLKNRPVYTAKDLRIQASFLLSVAEELDRQGLRACAATA